MKHLLGLKDVEAAEIREILDTAVSMKKLLRQNVKKLPQLQSKSVITLFYENSTRTRVSFELAAKYMSAATVNVSASTSSVQKGETLIDTGRTLDAMKTDVVIMRHPMAGAPKLLSENVRASVINAGDGMNEHPTQALLDMFTLYEKFGTLKGLTVAIVGDVMHSRVAKSNVFGLTKMGSEVRLFSPSTLALPEIGRLGAKVMNRRADAIRDADAVMGLRIQLERQKGGLFPSLSEYNRFFGVNEEDLKGAKPGALVMHPGPVNRGVEMSGAVIDSAQSVINEQVLNGVAVRMAILFLLTRN